MLSRLVAAVFTALLVVGGLPAAEVKGKVRSVDAVKGTLTIRVEEKDTEIKFTDEAKSELKVQITDKTTFIGPGGKQLKARLKDKAFQRAGTQVILTFEEKGGKQVVTRVKLTGEAKKDK